MSTADELIDMSFFDRIKVVSVFHNTVTGKSYFDSIEIIEIALPRLTLSLPEGSVIEQNIGVLEVYTAQAWADQNPPLLKVTGKIEAVESLDDKSLRAIYSVYQSDEASWKDFLSLYENRQNQIFKLFQSQKD